MPRFHLEGLLAAGATLDLPDEIVRHARVLRLREGDAITLFDGQGGEFPAELTRLDRSGASARLGAKQDIERESGLAVTLVQGVSSGERMDLTIQKAVELGVAAVQPVLAARSVVKLDAQRAEGKLAHWRRVVIAACEQCGRNRLPAVLAPLSVADYCARAKEAAPRLLLSPSGGRRFVEAAATIAEALVLAAGPEGGFDEAEEAAFRRAGFIPVALGPRVLRTETAAPAALAALNALRGDF